MRSGSVSGGRLISKLNVYSRSSQLPGCEPFLYETPLIVPDAALARCDREFAIAPASADGEGD
jgi:hypothetical protein